MQIKCTANNCRAASSLIGIVTKSTIVLKVKKTADSRVTGLLYFYAAQDLSSLKAQRIKSFGEGEGCGERERPFVLRKGFPLPTDASVLIKTLQELFQTVGGVVAE